MTESLIRHQQLAWRTTSQAPISLYPINFLLGALDSTIAPPNVLLSRGLSHRLFCTAELSRRITGSSEYRPSVGCNTCYHLTVHALVRHVDLGHLLERRVGIAHALLSNRPSRWGRLFIGYASRRRAHRRGACPFCLCGARKWRCRSRIH